MHARDTSQAKVAETGPLRAAMRIAPMSRKMRRIEKYDVSREVFSIFRGCAFYL